jgi:hypothetical protein
MTISNILSMKQIIIVFLCLIFLMAGIPTSASSIINLNARTNSFSNPVVLNLQAGTYSVESIGISDGGLYNSLNAWGFTSCTLSSGCDAGIPTVNTGWMSRYDVISTNLSDVSVDGVSLPAVSALPATHKSFFYVTSTSTYYEVFDGKVFPNAVLALANAHSSAFTVNVDGPVHFAIRDTAYGDNLGGMSLKLSAIPIPGAVWLFGSALISLVGIGKRNKVI